MPPSLADATLTATIVEIHSMSRRSYGAPRVHAELRLGRGVRCGRKRVARLTRAAGIAGISHRRKLGGCARPLPAPHDDLVQRRFRAEGPDQLWARPVPSHWARGASGEVLGFLRFCRRRRSATPKLLRSPSVNADPPLVSSVFAFWNLQINIDSLTGPGG